MNGIKIKTINNLINMTGSFIRTIESNPKQGVLILAGVTIICYTAMHINDMNNAHELELSKEYLNHDLPELCRNLNNNVTDIDNNDGGISTL
ncbi:MAG: hypothetical protein ACI4P1_03130 [Erysipelotrichaceae bacterium]